MKKGYLLLEDGAMFEGVLFGAQESPVGEVVFNTGMTGYQETLTDPSYEGQMVVMTYPLIGNYGFNEEDPQSQAPSVRGFIIREGCDSFSNWRGSEGLESYFFRQGLTGLMDVDTRALTRHLREQGTLRGRMLPEGADPASAMESILAFDNSQAVFRVTTREAYSLSPSPCRVAVLDFGVKRNILKSMVDRNMELTVFPADTPASVLLAGGFDGVFLSNGPGDPALLNGIVDQVRELIGNVPVFGICLGHQILAHALGGQTRRMKFGHRGSNHPVRDLALERVFITSQNHGYEVMEESLPADSVLVTHVNVNDGTVEGLRHLELPVFSVQYHPEACPGPGDSAYLFDRFLHMMNAFKEKQ